MRGVVGGFVIEQLIRIAEMNHYYWATHQGAEIDLVFNKAAGCMALRSNERMRRP